MKCLDVCCGILINNHQILCAQRRVGAYEYVSLKWEFPGGKLELGENPKQALKRELFEELDVDVDENSMKYFCTVIHSYPDFEIKLYCHICDMKFRTVHLKEHIDMKWVTIDKLLELDWAEADLQVVKKLVKNKSLKGGDRYEI